MFASCWAKVYTLLATPMFDRDRALRRRTPEEFMSAQCESGQGLQRAAKLAAVYAEFGTLACAERIPLNLDIAHWVDVLWAMECFVLAHEYAHIVAHQLTLKARGQLNAAAVRELEFFCDRLGFVLSRLAARKEKNFAGTIGIGALLFLRAIEISEYARDLRCRGKGERLSEPASGHPTCGERINALRAFLGEVFHSDRHLAVVEAWGFYDSLSSETNEFLRRFLPRVLAGPRGQLRSSRA